MYKYVAYVSQDSYIFNASLLFNLCLSNEVIDHEYLIFLIDKFNLNLCKRDLNSLSSFMISENGVNLSGGQCQKIVLIRCLYQRKKFILLDEATRFIDQASRKDIYDYLFSLDALGLIIIDHDFDFNNQQVEVVDFN